MQKFRSEKIRKSQKSECKNFRNSKKLFSENTKISFRKNQKIKLFSENTKISFRKIRKSDSEKIRKSQKFECENFRNSKKLFSENAKFSLRKNQKTLNF